MTYTLKLINDRTNGAFRIENEYYRLEESGNITDTTLRESLLVHAQVEICDYNKKHQNKPLREFKLTLEEKLK